MAPRTFFAALALFAGLGAGCEASSEAAASSPDEAALAAVTVRVEGMVCEACQSAIQDAVGKLPGVTSCTADHEKGEAQVRYDPAEVEPAQIAAAIEALGYEAQAPAAAEAP